MAKAEVFPWLGECWTHLCGLHERRRLPHALIVHGVQGIGKSNFATAFSKIPLANPRQPA